MIGIMVIGERKNNKEASIDLFFYVQKKRTKECEKE